MIDDVIIQEILETYYKDEETKTRWKKIWDDRSRTEYEQKKSQFEQTFKSKHILNNVRYQSPCFSYCIPLESKTIDGINYIKQIEFFESQILDICTYFISSYIVEREFDVYYPSIVYSKVVFLECPIKYEYQKKLLNGFIDKYLPKHRFESVNYLANKHTTYKGEEFSYFDLLVSKDQFKKCTLLQARRIVEPNKELLGYSTSAKQLATVKNSKGETIDSFATKHYSNNTELQQFLKDFNDNNSWFHTTFLDTVFVQNLRKEIYALSKVNQNDKKLMETFQKELADNYPYFNEIFPVLVTTTM